MNFTTNNSPRNFGVRFFFRCSNSINGKLSDSLGARHQLASQLHSITHEQEHATIAIEMPLTDGMMTLFLIKCLGVSNAWIYSVIFAHALLKCHKRNIRRETVNTYYSEREHVSHLFEVHLIADDAYTLYRFRKHDSHILNSGILARERSEREFQLHSVTGIASPGLNQSLCVRRMCDTGWCRSHTHFMHNWNHFHC